MRLERHCAALAAALLLTSAPGLARAASVSTPHASRPRVDADALSRISTVAHQVCTEPAQAGDSISGAAQLGGGATLPQIIARLAKVSITAMVKVGGAKWTGVRQEDLAPALANSDACAERIFVHIFDTLQLAHADTGQPIAKPTAARKAYRKLLKNPAATPSTIINQGGIVTLHQSGGTNTVINPPIPHSLTGLYINSLEVGRLYGVSQNGRALQASRLEMFDGQPPGVPMNYRDGVVVCIPAASGSSGHLLGAGHEVDTYFNVTCRQE